MKQRFLTLLAIGSTSICALVFTACGGDDTNNADSGGNDATTNDVVTNDSPQGTDTGTDTGPGNDAGLDVNVDTGCAPGPGCQACCAQANPDAAAFFLLTEQACACTTPGDCNTNQTCKQNLCANQAPNANCTQCLNNKDAGDCRAAATAACVQSSACQPLAQCVAKCASIINDAGGGG